MVGGRVEDDNRKRARVERNDASPRLGNVRLGTLDQLSEPANADLHPRFRRAIRHLRRRRVFNVQRPADMEGPSVKGSASEHRIVPVAEVDRPRCASTRILLIYAG